MPERTVATPLLETYLDLFCHRRDVFARQTARGSYFLCRQPISHQIIQAHLTGSLTAGWYALTPDNTVRWAVLDADRANGLDQLRTAWQQLDSQDIPSYLEVSRRGGHLWLLFEPTTSGEVARRLVYTAVSDLSGIEVYPKRDRLEASAPFGNLVRGPLGIHRLTGKRYPFVDPISRRPVASTVKATLEWLATAQRVGNGDICRLMATVASDQEVAPAEETPSSRASDAAHSRRREQLSLVERIKQQIGDPYVFISRFVELDERGRGHCPFHPPDRHPSFAVNRRAGYWVCFHEVNQLTGRYLGGDALEFYRRFKGLALADALSQLRHETRERY